MAMITDYSKQHSIKPTITLAQLYETQNQLFDALNIYELLYHKDQSLVTLDNIKRIKDLIFNNEQSKYNVIIQKIFNSDDLRKFRIIPESLYDQYSKSNESSEDDIEEEIEEEISEEIMESEPEIPGENSLSNSTGVIEDSIRKELKRGNYKYEEENITSIPVNELKISGLSAFVMKITKRDKRVGDLTLHEIFKILKGLNF